MPYLRHASLADAVALSQDMRVEDIAEIQANSGKDPLTALMDSVRYSDLPLAIVDEEGDILGMLGVVTVSHAPKVGVVWMLASPQILNHRRQFARESRQWVDTLQSQYDILCNVVDERNTVHIRWLQWCGFTFINRHEAFGVEQRPFLEFVRI